MAASDAMVVVAYAKVAGVGAMAVVQMVVCAVWNFVNHSVFKAFELTDPMAEAAVPNVSEAGVLEKTSLQTGVCITVS